MSTTTTATFRDYAFEDLAGGTFSIDTSGDSAVIRAATNHPEFANEIRLDHGDARELGTSLIRWTRSGEAVRDWYDERAMLTLDCLDGIATVTVHEDGELESSYTLSDEQAVDLGQRLIVWAGVAVNAPADA